MLTEHATQGHDLHHRATSRGMKVMAVMMGLCLGGTVLGATIPVLGVAGALVLAVPVGVAFAAVSLLYHQFMGSLMAVCCGGAVLLAAAPDLGIASASLVAVVVGAVVGVGSQKLMNRSHGH